MNHYYSNYKETDINTATPLKIILKLYDGSISFLKKSIEYSEKGDIKNKNIYANNAREIIMALNNSLNVEAGGEIAQNLRSLYLYMNRQVMQSNWQDNTQGLKEVIQLLSNLREAWEDIYSKIGTSEKPIQQEAKGLRISA